jgi:peptidoglycan/LPS O-acetylase OafA/YrhL
MPLSTQPLRPPKTQFSPNLDLPRSFAVLAVLADHIHGTFGISQRYWRLAWMLGSWGVMVFFVHTSFVLMMSLERLGLKGWQMYGTFYLRRLARIYPLSVVTIAIVLLAHIPESSWSKTGFEMPGKAAMLSNFLSRNESSIYASRHWLSMEPST